MSPNITERDFDKVRHYSASGQGFFNIHTPNPRMYLRFAEEDLVDGEGDRNRINALANAKRALHMYIEAASDAFGYSRWQDPSQKGFGRRVVFLRRCSLLAPNILSKINKLRNESEHEYIIPELSTVREYVEVVGLFLLAAEHTSFPLSQDIYSVPPLASAHYSIRCLKNEGRIELFNCPYEVLSHHVALLTNPSNHKLKRRKVPALPPPILSIDIQGEADIYFAWLRFMMS